VIRGDSWFGKRKAESPLFRRNPERSGEKGGRQKNAGRIAREITWRLRRKESPRSRPQQSGEGETRRGGKGKTETKEETEPTRINPRSSNKKLLGRKRRTLKREGVGGKGWSSVVRYHFKVGITRRRLKNTRMRTCSSGLFKGKLPEVEVLMKKILQAIVATKTVLCGPI